ncbi:MAG: thioesterase family protein [Mycobacteriaceae bacterium]
MNRPRPSEGAAFYTLVGRDSAGDEVFASSEHTVGPWSLQMQHVSPPAALAVRALELVAVREEMRLTRVTVEVLGAVPRAELTVRSRVERSGRQIELVVAELLAPGPDGDLRAVLRASGWRMAVTDTSDLVTTAHPPMPALPDQVVAGAAGREPPPVWLPGYIDAVEWRWCDGSFDERGPGRVWGRPRIPLVAGEEPSTLQQLFTVVDSSNGVGAPLDVRSWTFLNTDLTVHLFRDPVPGWTGLDVHTSIGPDGVGACEAVVHDVQGPVGRSAQILLVRPRR